MIEGYSPYRRSSVAYPCWSRSSSSTDVAVHLIVSTHSRSYEASYLTSSIPQQSSKRFLTDRLLRHSGHACTRRGKRQYCQLYRPLAPLALKGISQHACRVSPCRKRCRPLHPSENVALPTDFDLLIIREMRDATDFIFKFYNHMVRRNTCGILYLYSVNHLE